MFILIIKEAIMSESSIVLDFRENFWTDVLEGVKSGLRKKRNREEGFWFITDFEPEECLTHLEQKKYNYETYFISEQEYRVFIQPN